MIPLKTPCIIGYEGSSDNPLGTTFAASALYDPTRKLVINPITKHTCSIKRWDEVVKDGHATQLKCTQGLGPLGLTLDDEPWLLRTSNPFIKALMSRETAQRNFIDCAEPRNTFYAFANATELDDVRCRLARALRREADVLHFDRDYMMYQLSKRSEQAP